MSDPSSYDTFGSETENSGFSMSLEGSFEDDDLSDELTLLNGDEDSDEDSLLDDDFLRLKEKYNLQEATVELERCDKIWDTMRLLKTIQTDYDSENISTDNEDDELASSRSNSCVPESANSAVPYIKYEPVQGNGNNALPNFHLAVKSQKKVYHCSTCGKHFIEKRVLRNHSQKEHGIILPTESKRRPKTPLEINLRSGRDSVVDEKIAQNSSNRERDNSKSRLSISSKSSSVNEQKRGRGFDDSSTDSSTSRAKQRGIYDCPRCEETFDERPQFNRHCTKIHESYLSSRKNQTQVKREDSSIVKPKKEPPSSVNEISRRKHVKETKPLSRPATFTENPKVKREPSTSSVDDRKRSRKQKKKSGENKFRFINGVKHRFIFTCKKCSQVYMRMKSMRHHASVAHGLVIPVIPTISWGYSSKYDIKSDLFKAELVKFTEAEELLATRINAQRGNRSKSRKIVHQRKGIERPQRACTLKKSYIESMKDEDEEIEKIQSNVEVPSIASIKTPPISQPTSCFLCKKSFADIRKHLIDYHRINSPDSVLPLTAMVENENKEDQPQEAIDTRPKSMRIKKEIQPEDASRYCKKNVKLEPDTLEEKVRSYTSITSNASNRQTFQCTVCSYNYASSSGLERHIRNNLVDGIMRPHLPFERLKKKGSTSSNSSLADPIADPLALTDCSESSKTSNCVTSEDDDSRSATRKRTISSSDGRFTPSPEPKKRRRKIEDFENFENTGTESRSDSAQESGEMESIQAISESGSVEEAKSPSHRDTRASSDRDSGIGISITIKKRNNSYEVVDKDIGDEEKSKNFEVSKDNNLLCSYESSSDVTPVDFVSYDQETPGRDILNSIDCSKDEDVLGSVRTTGGSEVENENEKETDDRGSSNVEDNNFHWKEGCYREEACTNMRGKVPSLKVLCRTVLTTEELSMSNNVSLSHQCPVCCRFYPTERDVTVHMLEHKVN